jgi:Family of unknown function (DUF6334)
MTDPKTVAGEALFPVLSSFHDVAGLSLRAVQQLSSDGSHSAIAFHFESKTLLIEASPEDDTVILSVPDRHDERREDVISQQPWDQFIGREFGWGWVTINQQGYLDGVLLSFSGITPQIVITAVASSLKVGLIAMSTHNK